MKVSKKKIAALFMVLCLIMSSIPALAVQITIPSDMPGIELIPEEGLGIQFSALGWTGTVLRMVLGEETAALFKVNGNSLNDLYAGTTISATFTYKNVDGDPAATTSTGKLLYRNENGEKYLESFTVVDMPITSTTPNASKTKYCLEATADNFRTSSPEISAAYDSYVQGEGMAENDIDLYFNANDATSGYKITDIVIKRGSWQGSTDTVVDTQSFPEGTVFVSSFNINKNPADWTKVGNDLYTYYQNRAKNTDGPLTAFEAKESGTYAIWAYVKNRQDSDTSRTVEIRLPGNITAEFKKTNASEDIASFDDDKWYWEPAVGNKTITIEKGQTVFLQIVNNRCANARYGAFAFVPVEDNFTLDPETAQSKDYRFTEADFIALQRYTTNAVNMEKQPAVSVTVNGASVSAETGAGQVDGNGAALFDANDNYIIKPTVLDALACAGIDVSTYMNGYLTQDVMTFITLNGERITNPDIIYVQEGDVITTEKAETQDKTNFAPINAGTARNTEGGMGPDKGNHIKFCLTASKMPEFSNTKDDATGLTGCTFNGYIVTKIDFEGTPAGSKIYFENAEIFDIVAAGNRIDLEIDIKSCDTNKASEIALTTPDGITYHDPYRYVMRKSNVYDFSNLYITNSSSQSGITAINNGDHYVLVTETAQKCYLVTVTYDDNGNITNTETREVFVTLTEPAAAPIEENQKVFVWNYEPFAGTNMRPVCEPLTK